MADLSFNCSHCGAPLSYDGSDIPAVQCPFCNTTNAVPQELRPVKAPVIEFVTPAQTPQPVYYPQPVATRSGPKIGLIIGIIVAFVFLCGLVTTVGPIIFAAIFTNQAVSMVNSQVTTIKTAVEAIPTDAPAIIDTPTPAITITPTPGYAVPKVAFGKTGINPGQFTNPKFIVTDGSSTLYVAEDTGGRVQAFDLSGNYLYQWKVGNENTIIEGLAADRKGGVFISHDGYIYHYDGKTGDPVGKLNNTKGGEFGDLFMTPEGNLAAVWYEGRWGMITGLDGHSEALVIFSPAGKVLNTISSPISNQTGEPALDIYVAMDGKDDIYLMDEGTIYAYSPEGKYLNMFKPAQLSSPTAIRVDDLGQLFVGDSRQVIVLSSNGSFVTSFQVDHSVTALAYDDNSSLWVLTDQQVTQFVKNAQ